MRCERRAARRRADRPALHRHHRPDHVLRDDRPSRRPDALAAHVAERDDELGEPSRAEEVDEIAAEPVDLGQLRALVVAARAIEDRDLEAADRRTKAGPQQRAKVAQQPLYAGVARVAPLALTASRGAARATPAATTGAAPAHGVALGHQHRFVLRCVFARVGERRQRAAAGVVQRQARR